MKKIFCSSKALISALALIVFFASCAASEIKEPDIEASLNLNSSLAWYGNNRQVLDRYLSDHGLGGADYKPESYAMFDWDNTVIYSDIENCFVAYMALTGNVKRPPDDDWSLISQYVSPALEEALDHHCQGSGEYLPTNNKCVDSIFSAYYEGAVSSDEDAEDAFTITKSKLFRPDYAWGGQIARGWDEANLAAFSKASADWCLGLGLEQEVKVGKANYKLAIRFYEEILDIMVSLEAAGIPFIISTASPEYLVREAAKRLPVSPKAVLGVKLVKEDGVYTGRTQAMGSYGENEVMNYQLGKVIEALEFYEGVDTSGMSDEEIINASNISAAFSDSDTDAQFIKAAWDLAFTINRNKTGIMCPMYHWQANGDPDRPDKDFLINPIFIEEKAKSQKDSGYECDVSDLPEAMGINSIDAFIQDSVYWH